MSGLLRRHQDEEPAEPAPNPSKNSPLSPSAEPQPASEPAPAAAGSQAGPLKRALLDATDRVQQIIDLAEQTSDEVRAEASREAEQIVADAEVKANEKVEARVAELTGRLGPLAKRLEGVQAEVALLSTEIESLLGQARPLAQPEEGAPPPVQAPVAPARAEAVHAHAGAPGPGAAAEDSGDNGGDRALLRATQMVVAGNDREEIEEALRSELGVSEPGPIVDRALGVG